MLQIRHRLKDEPATPEEFENFCKEYKLTRKTAFAIGKFQREIYSKTYKTRANAGYLRMCLRCWIRAAHQELTLSDIFTMLKAEDFLIHLFDNFEWIKFLTALRNNKSEYEKTQTSR